MEWLSEEEKSRSMMPYLLNMPPLDSEEPKAKFPEAIQNKDNASVKEIKSAASKKSTQDSDQEKWHLQQDIVHKTPKQNILCFDTLKVNCDTNHKFLFDLKVSKCNNKVVVLSDSDMAMLRRIQRNTVKAKSETNLRIDLRYFNR